jgi:hypothetical protein
MLCVVKYVHARTLFLLLARAGAGKMEFCRTGDLTEKFARPGSPSALQIGPAGAPARQFWIDKFWDEKEDRESASALPSGGLLLRAPSFAELVSFSCLCHACLVTNYI